MFVAWVKPALAHRTGGERRVASSAQRQQRHRLHGGGQSDRHRGDPAPRQNAEARDRGVDGDPSALADGGSCRSQPDKVALEKRHSLCCNLARGYELPKRQSL